MRDDRRSVVTNFSMVPDRAGSDRRLRARHHRILDKVCRCVDPATGTAVISQRRLAEQGRLKRETVSVCLRQLQDWGYLVVLPPDRGARGRYTSNRYRVVYLVPSVGDTETDNVVPSVGDTVAPDLVPRAGDTDLAPCGGDTAWPPAEGTQSESSPEEKEARDARAPEARTDRHLNGGWEAQLDDLRRRAGHGTLDGRTPLGEATVNVIERIRHEHGDLAALSAVRDARSLTGRDLFQFVLEKWTQQSTGQVAR